MNKNARIILDLCVVVLCSWIVMAGVFALGYTPLVNSYTYNMNAGKLVDKYWIILGIILGTAAFFLAKPIRRGRETRYMVLAVVAAFIFNFVFPFVFSLVSPEPLYWMMPLYLAITIEIVMIFVLYLVNRRLASKRSAK